MVIEMAPGGKLGDDSFFMGIDVGTSSTKGVVMDGQGRILLTETVQHETSSPQAGYYEQDACDVWWHDVVLICRSLLSQIGTTVHRDLSSRILAMAVSGIGPCMLPVDDGLKPLRPAVLYGIDSRAMEECRELSSSLEPALGGIRFDSQSVLPKVRWYEKNEPENWRRTSMILGCGGYLTARLCGARVVDQYEAGSYAPLVSGDGSHWEAGMHRIGHYARLMPHIARGCSVVGHISAEAARQTGLAEGTSVVAPTIDAAAEAVGSGVTQSGDMMLMYGSTGFFIALHGGSQTLERSVSWQSTWLEPNLRTSASGINTLGLFFTWFIKRFGIHDVEEFTRLSRGSVPGAHGVVMMPFLEGERTPWFDPNLTSGIIGMRMETTREDLCRAAVETVAFSMQDAIAALGVTASRGFSVGGAIGNDVLVQTVSDLTGITQKIPANPIGASLGNALRAAVGVGYFASLQQASETIRYARLIKPDVSRRELICQAHGRFRRFLSRSKELSHEIVGSRER